MTEQIRKGSQTEAWKALVTRLPGVLGAEFILAGDEIREVHILSDQSRTAKQIVRDVQSAMLARFQIDLDHRIISVAQIPGSVREARRRLVCEELSISSGRTGGTVRVRLRLDDRDYSGEAPCELTGASRIRGIAQATAEALNQLLAPACSASPGTSGASRWMRAGPCWWGCSSVSATAPSICSAPATRARTPTSRWCAPRSTPSTAGS